MQPVWRKRYITAIWITLTAISLVLLTAALQSKNNKVCKGINVEINGTGNNFFIDKKEVLEILTATNLIKGEKLAEINLRMLEGRLKKEKWIANAELFFDTQQVLQVVVEEKEPVARIFTVGGSSFYIDSACNHLPLSNKLSARVPMFTSFPTDRIRLSKPDSALMASIKNLAMFVQANDFWKAQVAQINITHDGFEMVPTIGNHIVILGNNEDYKEKFDRLFSFYKQVWTKVGFEKYEKIDVQFKSQVVATKKGFFSLSIDSTKAKEAIHNLIAKSKRVTEIAPHDDSLSNKEPKGLTAAKQQLKALGKSEKVIIKTEVKPELKKAEQELVRPAAENVKVPKAIMKRSGK